MPNAPAIEAVGLSKRYGAVQAVEGVHLHVAQGELYGFLGLNGAGKSTTIRMLLGITRPSAGRAALFGERIGPSTRALWRRVGHLVERPSAYPELTVAENLEVTRRLLDVQDRGAVDRAIASLGLGPYRQRRAGGLSLGNLQRLCLARALLHEPALLVLDEPANGLDPAGVVEVRHLLLRLVHERGATVFMSSHILAEVDRLATRIGIVHQGRLIEELDAAELERRRDRRLEVGAREPEAAARALRAAGYAPQPAEGPNGQPLLELREPRALEAPDAVAQVLVAAGAPPLRLAIVQEDLEQHFLRLTREAP